MAHKYLKAGAVVPVDMATTQKLLELLRHYESQNKDLRSQYDKANHTINLMRQCKELEAMRDKFAMSVAQNFDWGNDPQECALLVWEIADALIETRGFTNATASSPQPAKA